MNDLFASLYELFLRLGFYNDDLAMHLYGYDCSTGGFDGKNLYGPIGLIMFFGSILAAVIFYYVINHPRFNKWFHWLLVLGINAVIQFLVAYIWLRDDLKLGKICEELIVYKEDIAGFSFSNLFLSVFFFTIASLIMRWWSKNCSCTPFPL